MAMDDIDWVFDTSREGTIPKGDGSWWLCAIKYWVIGVILVGLAVVAAVVTCIISPRNIAPELAFAVVMGIMIILFCIFLVWTTYRRAVRQNSDRKAEAASLNREIAQYYREKRQKETQGSA